MGKILIASNSLTVINSLEAKLVLLRESDFVVSCEIADVSKNLLNTDIVLLHTKEVDDNTFSIISNIKKPQNIIILIVEDFNPKAILNAYDKGVSYFCSVNITNFELLINIINAKRELKRIKKNEIFKKLLRDKNLLKQNSDIYTNLEIIHSANFYGDTINSAMLALNYEGSEEQAAKLPLIVRETDIVVNYMPNKYLIILPDTNLDNGLFVFNKLQKNLEGEISGVIFPYKEEGINELLAKINSLDMIREEKELKIYKDLGTSPTKTETETDWLKDDFSDETERKNFKLFQNLYNNKSEKVIEPAFYRAKQKYENSLANTKIKYLTEKDKAEFMLINFEGTNSLKILYQNSAKLAIKIKYSGLNSPENEAFEIPFSKFNIRKLMEMLDDFIMKSNLIN